jgi:hypothetical protein
MMSGVSMAAVVTAGAAASGGVETECGSGISALGHATVMAALIEMTSVA